MTQSVTGLGLRRILSSTQTRPKRLSAKPHSIDSAVRPSIYMFMYADAYSLLYFFTHVH